MAILIKGLKLAATATFGWLFGELAKRVFSKLLRKPLDAVENAAEDLAVTLGTA